MLTCLHRSIALAAAISLAALSAPARADDFKLPPQVKPALPNIPDKTFNFADYGANPDGKTMNTDAFKKAFAAIDKAGGGKLVLAKGTYLTLPLNLVSHLEIHLEEGALIQFPKDKALYSTMEPLAPRPDFVSNMDGGNASLLFGDKLTDIALTGKGTIDGGGAGWYAVPAGAPGANTRAPDLYTFPALATLLRPANFRDASPTFFTGGPPATVPGVGAPPRGAGGGGRGLAQVGQIKGRPKLLILTSCQRVLVDGLTIENSPMGQVVPVMCADVTLTNLTVIAPQRSANTDALNPTACTNVLIKNCDLSVGDDNIALKALGGPNSNIWIEDVRSKFGHGISIGSETYGGVHDVTVVHCTFDGGDNGLRIKSARDRGNQLFNFTFSDIKIDNVKNPIFVTMYYSGGMNRTPQPITATTPFLKNVQFHNITIRNGGNAGQILGLPEAPATDITLTNVDIEANTGFTVQDTKNCIFDNVKIKVKSGEAIIDKYKADLTIKPAAQ